MTDIPRETAVRIPPCARVLAPAVDAVAPVLGVESLGDTRGLVVVDPEFETLLSLNEVELEVVVGVSKPLHTTTSVPCVLVRVCTVGISPFSSTEDAEAETDADVDAEIDPEVCTVNVFPPTTYSPPGPTLTVFTETGVVVVVIVVVAVLADRLEICPLMTTAFPEEAREYVVP